MRDSIEASGCQHMIRNRYSPSERCRALGSLLQSDAGDCSKSAGFRQLFEKLMIQLPSPPVLQAASFFDDTSSSASQ